MDWTTSAARVPNTRPPKVGGEEQWKMVTDSVTAPRSERTITEKEALQWFGLPHNDGPPVLIGTYHGPRILEQLVSQGWSGALPCARTPA